MIPIGFAIPMPMPRSSLHLLAHYVLLNIPAISLCIPSVAIWHNYLCMGPLSFDLVPVPDGGPSTGSSSSGEDLAKLVPHEGRVFVDFDAAANRWQASDIITHEVCTLPPARGWELECDSEGYAIALVSSEGAELDLDELLPQTLYALPDERQLTLLSEPDTGFKKTYLDTASAMYCTMLINIKVGCMLSILGLSSALFDMARGGCQVFWSLSSIAESMKFGMFKGDHTRWAWQGLPQWQNSFRSLGLSSCHLLRSMQYASNKRKQGADPDRVLSFQAASTVGLLALLSQWAHCSPRQGGIKSAREKQCSADLLQAFVDAACKGQEWQATVLVDDTTQWHWPRPLLGTNAYKLNIIDGVVQLGPLSRYMDNLTMPVPKAAKWLKKAKLDTTESIGMAELFSILAGLPDLAAFRLQLFVALGMRLEAMILMQHAEGAPAGDLWLIKAASAEDDISSPASRDLMLQRHWAASLIVAEQRGPLRMVSLCTDKSRVGGLPLQNTAVVLPSGECIMCFPQVPGIL